MHSARAGRLLRSVLPTIRSTIPQRNSSVSKNSLHAQNGNTSTWWTVCCGMKRYAKRTAKRCSIVSAKSSVLSYLGKDIKPSSQPFDVQPVEMCYKRGLFMTKLLILSSDTGEGHNS